MPSLEAVKELKVSKNTEAKKLAGTIKHYLCKDGSCVLYALGSQPICVAVKSVALLDSMFGLDYHCKISYFHQTSETGDLSGIQFSLYKEIGRE